MSNYVQCPHERLMANDQPCDICALNHRLTLRIVYLRSALDRLSTWRHLSADGRTHHDDCAHVDCIAKRALLRDDEAAK